MLIENNYSVIGNTCAGGFIYEKFYPEKNPSFIEYNTPFVGTLFLNDFEFLDLCEKYDEYTLLTPVFGEPKDDTLWFNQEKIKRYFNSNYPVLHLSNIEIHYIHDSNESLILKKFHGRLSAGKNSTRIFVWATPLMMNLHDDDERSILINRFLNISDYSIFLTKRKDEVLENDKHVSFYVEEWSKLSEENRMSWYAKNIHNQYRMAEIFKYLIIKKFF